MLFKKTTKRKIFTNPTMLMIIATSLDKVNLSELFEGKIAANSSVKILDDDDNNDTKLVSA